MTKNYNHTFISLSKVKSITPNTIKIPEMYRDFVSQRISKYRTFNFYIHQLIQKYSYLIHDQKLKRAIGLKTRYQDKGLNLFPKKFRVYDNSDWSVLKILAGVLNVSRCFLIVMFIEFDMAGIEESIVATKPKTNFGYRELLFPKKSILILSSIKFTSPPK